MVILMSNIENFKAERNNKKEGIIDIYNPNGYSIEKENEEFLSTYEKVKNDFAKYVGLWRVCPDLFIDFITPKNSKFKLFFYQRIFLRTAMRSKYFYATFTRAFSKSFLSILILHIKLVLYPGISLFICSGGKGQASNIAKEKIEEIWEKFPLLKREIKDYQFAKDYVKIVTHSNSKLDIVAVRESSRGGRRHAGLIEEAILVDGTLLNEVIVPLMNVNRRAKNGDVDPNEPHKQQIFVTTAGYKNTFAYNKLKQILVWMAVKENEAFVLGGSWRIPVLHKLLDPNFVEELKEDGTYNPLSFDREYESIWTGSGEDSFFNEDIITRNRTIKEAEDEPDKKMETDAYRMFYIISVDVARSEGNQNANTVALISKIKQNKKSGLCVTNLVNMKVFHGEHFEEQSIKVKKIIFKYNAEMCVVDGNGLGAGLMDYLVKDNIDDTGEVFPALSVINDSSYDKYKTQTSLPLLYSMKSQGIAGQIHVNCLSQISSGKVKFLIDEMEARANIIKTKKGKDMQGQQMAEYLSPYLNTTLLKDEMLNLKSKQSGKEIILDRINSGIQKDRFSATEYLLWYVKDIEDKAKRPKESYDNFDSLVLW